MQLLGLPLELKVVPGQIVRDRPVEPVRAESNRSSVDCGAALEKLA